MKRSFPVRRKLFPKQYALLCGLLFFFQFSWSQTSYTWNGSVSTSWSTAGNWSPAGVPGSADNVTIVTGSNNCVLSANTAISTIKVSSGVLDLGGFTLTTSGSTIVFSAGTVQNGTVTVSGATNTSFGNGPVTMNCVVNVSSATVTLRNTTFQNTTTITKTGTTNDYSYGANVFNGAVTFNNPSSGYIVLANNAADLFNAAATFNNTGYSNIYVAHNSANNIFNGVTTFNNAPLAANAIYVSQNSAGTTFNGNVVVSSSSGNGISIGGGTATSVSLAAGKTITVGAGGYSSGILQLRQFTQVGATAQSLTLTGTGNLTFGPNSSFDGDVTAVSPTMYLNGCNFNGVSNFTKNGTTGDWSNGGNVFNGVCSFTNSASSYFLLGNNSPDIWNSDVTFTDNGSERMLPCWGSVGNQFNGNIYVNTSGSAQGIQFCGGNSTATATLAAGKTIQPGSTGLTAGYLYLKQFTQLGNTAINLTGTGTSVMYLGPNSNFGGAVTVTAPDIWAQGATYNGAATFNKTGGNYNHNNQYQNIFNSTCTINQQSSGGYFMLGYNSNDLFNDNITVTSTGSGGIYFGWQSGTGTPTLAAGKTIQVGSAGFSAGFLWLNTFTQLGNAPINLSFTGTNTWLRFARQSVIGGDVTTNTPDIYFNGCTFNGVVNATKTGANNDFSSGGNTFQGATTINNPSTGQIGLGNGNADTTNSTLTLNSTGSSYIAFGWNSAGNVLNGNVIVNSTNSSTGIYFGNSTGSSIVMSAGSTVQIGSGGFSTGTLLLRQFTQLGSVPMNLTLTGANTIMQVGPLSAFGGAFTTVSPRILLNGATFNDVASFTKNGVTGEWSNGGNVFNGVTTVNQQGGGYFGFANGASDIYNADLYVNNNSTERVIFGNNSLGNQYNGNIILTQTGSSTGTAFGWNSNTAGTMAAGKTISIGSAGFNVGYLQLMRFTQLGNAAVSLPLTGTAALTFGPTSAIGGDMTSTSAALYFNGCTFGGVVNATKTGASSDWSGGGNIFNGVTTITNNGTGFLLMGNGSPDQFMANTSFVNNAGANMYIAYNSAGNVFNGVTTFTNSPTIAATMYISSNSAGTQFNDSLIVNSTYGSGIQFCSNNTTATTTVAAGKTISIGSLGFSSGVLLLKQFTQLGTAPSTLTLTGVSNLTFGALSAFGGDMTSSSPTLYLNGTTFNGGAYLTKTGTTGDWSTGGNVFNGPSVLTNTGSSYLLLGNTYPDTWNNDVTFTNTGSERILPAWATAGNQFNGNIYVNTGGSAQGITFCGGNSTATATLAAGKTIAAGSTGLNSGYLVLKQFTQLGNTPINLTLSSTATTLQYGPASSFGGDVTSSSPGLFFNGATFSGAATCTKTGASNDGSVGNNVFNGVTVVTNAGSGYLRMGDGNRDQFNAAATFNNTGTNNLLIAYNSAGNVFGGVTTFNNAPTTNNLIYVSPNSTGTVFNDNILVTSTYGSGVQFCNNAASATLAAGKTISVGAAGFTAGTLLLKQFTQAGATAQSLTLTGSGNLTFGPLSNFGGDVTTVSPALFFNGCVFGGTVNSTKNGTTNDASVGNNTFNGPFTVTNTGAGYFLMGNGNADTWNSTATFNNQSTAQHMYTAYYSSGNTFNGDVYFNNTPGATGLWIYTNNTGSNTQFNGNIYVSNVNGGGVYFGNGSGNAVLSSGRTIAAGAAGFNSGILVLKNFRQSGAGTAQNIVTTGTSTIQFYTNTMFDGAVTTSSPGILFNGTTFNGTVSSVKTGSTNDQSSGNNVFNGTSTFTNNGTGYLMMTNNAADAYNGNVNFVQNSTGAIYPNYNNTSNYAGNVTVTSPSSAAITFGNGSGTAQFTGSGAQSISASSSTPTPVFTRLIIANTGSGAGSGVTLNNTSINVSKVLTMTSGLLNTSSTYILTMLNASTTTVGNALSTSYVNGPMRYQKSTTGSTVLNFPVGKYPDSRPAVLTVNHANGTLYTYTTELFDASARGLGWQLPPTVNQVSDYHYWVINRTNSAGTSVPKTDLSGNQTIQLYFGSNDAVSDGSMLTVCKNTYTALTTWIDIGGVGGPVATGSNLTGSITCTNTPSQFNSFSTFTLGNVVGGNNVLPTQLLYFSAKPDNDQVDLSWGTASEAKNAGFTIERSRDGVSFSSLLQVASKGINGTSNIALDYTAVDVQPYSGKSYYRLKQTDMDGGSTYSDVVAVNFDKSASMSVYPNPTKGTIYIKGIDVNLSSVRVEWYDLGGRLLSQEVTAASYGVAKLEPRFNNGVYVLKIVGSDGVMKVVNVIIMK